MTSRRSISKNNPKWDLEALACNCARCKAEINCGTKSEPFPARRVNGRPYCFECYAKITRGTKGGIRTDDRERVERKPLEDNDIFNW